jgi:SMODS and SLOG-associating 2TM effector domain
MADERSPLLGRRSFSEDEERDFPTDPHKQFCTLIGIPPSDLPKDSTTRRSGNATLYERACSKRTSQSRTYTLTAAVSNTLLLTQIVFGATLTALGASESSHILITLFGVLNTIIAGLVAYLKSRGQPMRARMFRDDLEQVVNEIENSEVMWLGWSPRISSRQQGRSCKLIVFRDYEEGAWIRRD